MPGSPPTSEDLSELLSLLKSHGVSFIVGSADHFAQGAPILDVMKSRRLWALVWTGVIITVGLIVRRAPLNLPALVTKYGSSLLWAAMVYAILVVILSRWRPLMIGILAGALALAVELFKLVHTPGLDEFRLTLPGQLLIGRVFSCADIVAYWVAIALATTIDLVKAQAVRPQRQTVLSND